MARELYRFRVVTSNKDSKEWEPAKLRQHLEQLTLLTPEVQVKDFPDLNPLTHTGFEVRLRAEQDVARVFFQTLKVHFRTEQL